MKVGFSDKQANKKEACKEDQIIRPTKAKSSIELTENYVRLSNYTSGPVEKVVHFTIFQAKTDIARKG